MTNSYLNLCHGCPQTYHSLPSARLQAPPLLSKGMLGFIGSSLGRPLTLLHKSSSSSCDVARRRFSAYFLSSFLVRRHIITAIRTIVNIAAPHIPAISGRFFSKSNGLKHKIQKPLIFIHRIPSGVCFMRFAAAIRKLIYLAILSL